MSGRWKCERGRNSRAIWSAKDGTRFTCGVHGLINMLGEDDFATIRKLAVGESYTDQEGDRWTRVE